MTAVQIHVKKHDNRTTRIFTDEVFLGEINGAYICHARSGMQVREMKKDDWWLHYNHHFVFPRDALFNFMVLEKDGGLEYYCNLASRPVLANGVLAYTDYDIDVVRSPDGTITVHDLDEFAERINLYGYPDDLVIKLRQTQAELEHALARRSNLFSAEFYDTICRQQTDHQ